MAYADVIFYRTVFIGRKISDKDFLYYAERATDYLYRQNIDNNVDEILIKKACCAVAEVLHSYDDPEQNISSEKVGDTSVSYATKSAESKQRDLLRAMYMYIPILRWC